MTRKLFYDDSHMQEFDALVLSCEERKDGYAIVLDQTAFFPEGGGQSGDTGYLNEIPVVDTHEKNDIVYHYTQIAMEPGTCVHGKIDYAERFSCMQQHSGEHIVSGLVNHYFGYNNVGFHLGKDVVTMDFDGPLTWEDLMKIEWEANEAVAANLPVLETYPSKEELKDMFYRSKIEIEGQVRIVTIPGYDVCACCAPHVKYTGEIGMIKIVGMIHYKGGSRVSMLCGFRALTDYRKKEENVVKISNMLSAKQYETAAAVEKLHAEQQKWKEKSQSYLEKYLQEKLEHCALEAGPVLLFLEDGDMNVIRKSLQAKVTMGIGAAFVGNERDGYHYIMTSEDVNLRELSKEMNQELQGKGGGKPQMVQGSVQAVKSEIEGYFLRIIKK